jgi:hypothetical protein
LDFSYSVFGFSVRSNRPIPGLNPANATPLPADIQIHLAAVPFGSAESSPKSQVLLFVSSILDKIGEPAFKIWKIAEGDFLHLKYCDGVQFWIKREGGQVWAQWPETSSLEDAATYLLGPVMGLALCLRGVPCLHASAVVIENRAIAFVGEEGAGKSTTAAAFSRRGHAVLSDDIVALVEQDGAIQVRPAYPYLSLWPDSVRMLYGLKKDLPSFSGNWEKRVLSTADQSFRFANQSFPLGAIVILGERSRNPTAPLVDPMTPQDGLLSLVANSYATRLLSSEMRAHEFRFLGRVILNVPVFRVRPHEDPARIDRLCDLICEALPKLLESSSSSLKCSTREQA